MNESATLVATITQAGTMDAAAVVAIGALVTTLSQVTKRVVPGDVDAWAPLIAVIWSVIGTGLWVISQPHFEPRMTDAFPTAVGLAGIMLTSIGTYEIANMTTKTPSIATRRKKKEPESDQIEQIINRAASERTVRTTTEGARG